MNWLELVIVALAASRLTRLVVSDTITEPLRRAVWKRWPGHDTSWGDSEVTKRSKDTFGREVGTADGLDVFRVDGVWFAQRPRMAGALIECSWCAGVWVGVSVFALWWFYPVVVPFLAALAIAEVVGHLND